MQSIQEQRVQLLYTIGEMLNAFEEGVSLSNDDWNELCQALSTLGLPPENIMFVFIDALRNKAYDEHTFIELDKYFNRFFNAQKIAAVNSLKMSDNYLDGKFGCDREFIRYKNEVRNNNHETLENSALDGLKKIKKDNPTQYKFLTTGANDWYFEGNKLEGIDGDNNTLIKSRVSTLKDNIDHLVWLYNNLADTTSRRSLNALIKFYLTFDSSEMKTMASYSLPEVEPAIFPFYDDEVFVDCGSFIGDTVASYVNTVNYKYKRIYTYEISRKSIEEIKKNLRDLPNIIINHKGTGNVNTTMNLIGLDEPHQANALSETDINPVTRRVEYKKHEVVEVVRLDDDIKEPVTHIKIDVEGMDKETLCGASNLIKKYHPKLHVDSYHKLEDLIKVPLLIREIDPSYTLYMRIYSLYPFDNIVNPSLTFQAI